MPAPNGNKFALGHHCGRPKEYTKEFIEAEAEAFIEWMQKEDSIWYEDFAVERGYPSDYICKWAKENEVFDTVYQYSKSWQKSKLIKNGLLNKYNAHFCKFVMGNTVGWTDKTQVSGDAQNPLAFVLNKIDGSSKDLNDEQS